MRPAFVLLCLFALLAARAAEPFEIKDGDRVLLLGDTLLERENTYGTLELRMHEQFPERKFSVRNLSWAGETPRGISRASFDPPEKGFERLKEQIALVKPTVVFLGFGMAASLQEMTDRSRDWTLNPDPARYGAEPMSAGRFKRELGELMDAIGKDTRFVLLSPIRHEDLRATRPGLPDPAAHNQLLEQYSKAIEELAKESGARFVSLAGAADQLWHRGYPITENGIHASEPGYDEIVGSAEIALGWEAPTIPERDSQGRIGKGTMKKLERDEERRSDVRAAILRKNALWFHRTRPANETYLTGFRKHEQGQNAKEIPEFDPLVEQADAEIDRLKRAPKSASAAPEANRSVSEAKSAAPISSGVSNAPSGVPHPPAGVVPPASGVVHAPSGVPNARAGVAGPASGVPHPASGVVPPAAGVVHGASGVHPAPSGDVPPGSGVAPISQGEQPLPQFDLGENLEITLWAANPLLVKPTQMNWDALGRLWVCGTAHYPQIAPGEIEKDQIFILEDTDRDGKADKSTPFAGGMLMPTGIVPDLQPRKVGTAVPSRPPGAAGDATRTAEDSGPYLSACYVGASTELLHFADTDGDGTADQRRIVFSGFGTEDTHHTVHTLKWGPDGRLYFDQSVYIHSHLETPYGMVRLNAGGVFAYDPRTERVEVFSKGLWNPWGHAIDRHGQHFLTDGAGRDGIAWAFPGAVFAPSEGARQTMPLISPGTYPKFAGLELIHSPHFPDDWQGTAVTCDFRAHRIVRFKINDLGPAKSGFVTAEQPDVARTADIAFRPIDVKLGPDGALYIADWTNPVINHGEVDFRDPRRDKTGGRIWRVSYKGRETVKWEPLVGQTADQLIEKLTTENDWERTQVRETLRRTNWEAVGKAVNKRWFPQWPFEVEREIGIAEVSTTRTAESFWRAMVESKSPQDRALGVRIIARDWPRFVAAGAAFVRKLADEGIKTAPNHDIIDGDGAMARLASDAAARVRVETMRGLARTPSPKNADLILTAALAAPADDPHYAFAAWRSVNDVADVWVDAVLKGEWKPEGREKQLEFALKSIEPALAGKVLAQLVGPGVPTGPRTAGDSRPYRVPLDGSGPWFELIGLAGSGKELRALLDAFAGGKVPAAAEARALGALVDATRNRNLRPDGDIKPALEPLRARLSDPSAVRLLGLWKLTDPMPEVAALARDGKTPQPIRNAAFDALKAYGDASAMRFLDEMTRPEFPLGLRRHALVTIAQVKLDAGLLKSREILRDIKNPDEALQTWRALLALQGAPMAFAHRMPQDLPPAVYAAGLRAAREMGRKTQELVKVLTPLAGVTAAPAAPADYSDLAAQTLANGDPVAGEEIYRRVGLACTTCHAIGGAGGKVGPELGTIGASAPLDYIIESMLNPGAKVKEGYNAVSLTQIDGNVSMGVIVRESANDIVIRTATGQEQTIAKEIIKQKDNLGSIMPPGLLDPLKPREKLNLYAFLAQLGKKGVYDASKGHIARTWWLGKDEVRSAKVEGMPVLSNVDGRLPRERLAEMLAIFPNAPAVFATAKLTAAAPTKTQLLLLGVREAWLDGKPLAVASEPALAVELSAGDHTLTVKLDPKSLPEVLRVEAANVRFLTE